MKLGLYRRSETCYVVACASILTTLSASPFLHAASATWAGAAGTQNWSTSANWTPAGAPGGTGTTNNTDTATFNGPTAAQVISVDSARNLASLIFSPTGAANTYTFAGGPLVLTTGGSITVNPGGTSGVTAASFTSNVTLEGNYSFVDNGTPGSTNSAGANTLLFANVGTDVNLGNMTLTLGGTMVPPTYTLAPGLLAQSGNAINGVLSDGTATSGTVLSVLKNGTATWVLHGANTYDGSTTIDGGTLNVGTLAVGGSASSLGRSSSAASNLVFNGGTLLYTGWSGTSGGFVGNSVSTDRLFTIGDATGAGDSAVIDNSDYNGSAVNATSTISGLMSFTGTGSIAYGDSNAHSLTLQGENLGNNMFDLNITDGGGPTSVNKAEAGTWVLGNTVTNTYSGPTTITGGVLRDTSGHGLSVNSDLVLNGGVYETGVNLNRALGTGAGQVVLNGGQSGFSANGGAVTVTINNGGNPLKFGTAGFSPTALILNQNTATSAITLTNNLDLNGAHQVVEVNANTATISGSISNSGAAPASLSKQGVGTLNLTSANSYDGGTSVGGGVLSAAVAGSLGSGNATAWNGAELRLSSTSALAAGKTVTLNNATVGIGTDISQSALNSLLGAGSTGNVALNGTQISALNLSTLGNGALRLGSSTGGTYAASSLTVSGGAQAINNTVYNTGGTYLLGAGGGTLTITGSNVLTDQAPVLLTPNIGNQLRTTTTGTDGNPILASTTNTRNSMSIGDSSSVAQNNAGGTIDLQAAQNYTGYTTINNGGGLVLDYSTSGAGPVGNMVSESSPVILNGGTLGMIGGAGATDTETFDNVTVGAGTPTSTITTKSNGATSATLNLGNLSIGKDSQLLFAPATGDTTTVTFNNPALLGSESSGMKSIGNGAAVYNLNGSYYWAGTSSATGPYTVTNLTGESPLANGTITNANTDYQMTGSVTPAQADAMNLLRGSGTTAITLAMGAHQLQVNGILYSGTGSFNVTGTTAGGITTTTGTGALYLDNYSANTMTINDPITGAIDVVYGGTGTIFRNSFAVNDTYSGNTYLNGAIVSMAQNTSAFGTGNGEIFINGGGMVSGGGTTATPIKENMQWNGNFSLGKAANGASGNGPAFSGSVAMTNNITITVNTGGLGGWAFSGQISDGGYGYGLSVAGSSENPENPTKPIINSPLNLSGNNTFTGPINILGNGINVQTAGVINAHNVVNMAANTYLYLINANINIAGLNSIGSTNGSAIVTSTTRGYALILNGNGNYTFDGTLQDGTTASTLTMAGVGGTETLTGASTLTGAISANAGTLVLDASQGGALTGTNPNPLAFGGGTFELKGSSTNTTQKMGAVTVNAGGSTLLVDGNGGNTTLTLGTVTSNIQGGSLDIVTKGSTAPSMTSSSANNSAGTLGNGGHIVYTDASGHTTWATGTSVGVGVNSIGAYTNDTTPMVTSGGTTGTTTAYNLTGSQVQTGTAFAALLRISNLVSGSLDLGGFGLTMNQDGILFNGTSSYSIIDSVGTGTITSGTSDREIIVQNYGTSAGTVLTLGAVIANTGATPSALVLSGPGTTALTASNTYSGATFLNGPGVVNFNGGGNFGTGTSGITLSGSTLQYATGNVTDMSAIGHSLTFNASGGTIDTNDNKVTYNNSFGLGTGGMTVIDSSGGGSLTIQGKTGYTGYTTVQNGGDLIVGASGDLTTGLGTIVGNHGTLQGGSSISGSNPFGTTKAGTVTLQQGGVIAPGAGLGIQSIQNTGLAMQNNGSGLGTSNVLNMNTLTFNQGGTLKFELDNTIDSSNGAGTAWNPSASTQINLGQGALVKGNSGVGGFILDFGNTGNWDTNGLALDINGNPFSDGGDNVYDLINFGGTSLTGGLDGNTNFNIDDFSIQNLNGIGVLSFWYNSSAHQEELLLTVVPEPSTWAMMLTGLAILVVWTSRRRPNRKS